MLTTIDCSEHPRDMGEAQGETLRREIQPALRKDGGDIELVDVDGNTVFLRLCGNCAACSASSSRPCSAGWT